MRLTFATLALALALSAPIFPGTATACPEVATAPVTGEAMTPPDLAQALAGFETRDFAGR